MSKYEEVQIVSGGGNTKWDRERLKRVANDLAYFIDKEAAVLDIGCANGGLLAILKEQGYANLTGLDQSQACVDYLNKSVGIRAIQGGIFNLEFENKGFVQEKFELVILSHVLEHICDLQLALDFIGDKLEKNAFLYVETPDAANYFRYPQVPFYYFDSEHINHFDLEHLKLLFEPKGYLVEWHNKKEVPVSDDILYPSVAILFRKAGSKDRKIKN